MNEPFKHIFTLIGGCFGWLIAEFRPTFPLMIVAIIFIVYDAVTAFKLEKRVALKYPNKTKVSKFSSYAFGKLLRSTIPSRLMVIVLSFLVEHWVFTFLNIPLSYIVTGIICFEQAWSILENESSCRDDDEGMFWHLLQKIMIDKTSRHFDVNIDELVDELRKTAEAEQKLASDIDKSK